MSQDSEADVSNEDLNDSELRLECERVSGKKPPLWTPREVLLGFLAGEVEELPTDPMIDVRIYQVSAIIDRYDTLKAQMMQPLRSGGVCDGCCFNHDDIRVIECQILNPNFRHPNYPDSH